MRIKLATPLLGEFPRFADVKLPDNTANFTPPTVEF